VIPTAKQAVFSGAIPDGNQVDEVFTRDGTWRPGWWLRDYERGDDNRPFVELTPEKADAVIQRWTKKWAEEDSGTTECL